MDVDWMGVLQAVNLLYGIPLEYPRVPGNSERGSSPNTELSLGSSKVSESWIAKGVWYNKGEKKRQKTKDLF